MNAFGDTKRLGDVAEVSAGSPAPQDVAMFTDGTYPFFRMADAGQVRFGEIYQSTDYLNDKGVKGLRWYPKGTILFPKSGASTFLNYRVMLGVEGCVSSHLATIVADEAQINARFLLYFLSTIEAQDLVQDHAYPSLNLPTISGLSIPVPSLGEQRRIVGILDGVFAGIAAAKGNTGTNLQNAHALFESHLQSVFTQPSDEWHEATIGEVCTIRSGTTVPVGLERTSGGIPYVKVAEMTMPANRDGITTSIRFLDRSDVKPGWVIPAGAVIFPKRGGAILTNKKRLALVDMCADLNIMSVIPSDRLASEFLYFYFLGVNMAKIGSGSSIPQINNYDIAPLPIAFPTSKKLQAEVATKLKALEKECQVLTAIYERKIAALDALKTSFLHRAFSGNL